MTSLTNTIAELGKANRRLSTLLGEPYGFVSFSGTVADLKLFVAGGAPDEKDWLEAHQIIDSLKELDELREPDAMDVQIDLTGGF